MGEDRLIGFYLYLIAGTGKKIRLGENGNGEGELPSMRYWVSYVAHICRKVECYQAKALQFVGQCRTRLLNDFSLYVRMVASQL